MHHFSSDRGSTQTLRDKLGDSQRLHKALQCLTKGHYHPEQSAFISYVTKWMNNCVISKEEETVAGGGERDQDIINIVQQFTKNSISGATICDCASE